MPTANPPIPNNNFTQDPDAPDRDGSVFGSYDDSYRGVKAQTTPFSLSTEEGDINLNFWVNPSECSWRVGTRTTIEQIQGGAVHHEWFATGVGGQQQQKFEMPVLNFTFQSGNVAPYSWLPVGATQNLDDFASGSGLVIPQGLCNLYDFLALLNAPNLTSDGLPNYINISYFSLMMPNILLKGFFSQEGVQWTDTADNPNGISSWGASFIVFESYPSLFDRQGLRDVYNNAFGLGG